VYSVKIPPSGRACSYPYVHFCSGNKAWLQVYKTKSIASLYIV